MIDFNKFKTDSSRITFAIEYKDGSIGECTIYMVDDYYIARAWDNKNQKDIFYTGEFCIDQCGDENYSKYTPLENEIAYYADGTLAMFNNEFVNLQLINKEETLLNIHTVITAQYTEEKITRI